MNLPNDNEIEQKAWKYKNMPVVVNEKGLKFKMYSEFISGAIWLRDLFKKKQKELLIDFYKYIDSEHPEIWSEEKYQEVVNKYLNKQ